MVHTISAINDKGKLIVLGYGPVKSDGSDLPEGKNYKQYLRRDVLTISSSLMITENNSPT